MSREPLLIPSPAPLWGLVEDGDETDRPTDDTNSIRFVGHQRELRLLSLIQRAALMTPSGKMIWDKYATDPRRHYYVGMSATTSRSGQTGFLVTAKQIENNKLHLKPPPSPPLLTPSASELFNRAWQDRSVATTDEKTFIETFEGADVSTSAGKEIELTVIRDNPDHDLLECVESLLHELDAHGSGHTHATWGLIGGGCSVFHEGQDIAAGSTAAGVKRDLTDLTRNPEFQSLAKEFKTIQSEPKLNDLQILPKIESHLPDPNVPAIGNPIPKVITPVNSSPNQEEGSMNPKRPPRLLWFRRQ